jgi:hypothetical protein
MARPRSAVPRLCGLCGVQVGKNNRTARCRQCSKNAFCPTPEQILTAGEEIRRGWSIKTPQMAGETANLRSHYVPRVYRLDLQ